MSEGMQYFDLPEGAQYTIDGEECVVVERRGHAVWFKTKFAGEHFRLDDSQLATLMKEGTLCESAVNRDDPIDVRNVNLDVIDPKYQSQVAQRLEFVRAYLDAPYGEKCGKACQFRNEAIARRLEMDWVPDERTTQDWVADYMKDGLPNAANLVPAHAMPLQRRKRYPQRIHDLAKKVLDSEYLQAWNPSMQRALDKLEEWLELERDKSGLSEKELPTPSIMFLWRKLDTLPEYHKTARRRGKDAAEQRYNRHRKGFRYEYPLQCVMADTKNVDIAWLDENGDKHVGLSWTVMFDGYSKMIRGYYLGPEAESYELNKRALRMAVLPKSELIEHHNEEARRTNPEFVLHEPYPCCGVPERLVMDPGPANRNHSLIGAAGALGIHIEFNKAKNPHLKAQIERFFKTADQQFWHNLPGNRGSSIKERAARQPEKHAVFRLSELRTRLLMYVADTYHANPHEGLDGRSPLQVETEGMRRVKGRLIPSEGKLSVLLCHQEDRMITSKGVQFFDRSYWHDDFPVLLPANGGSVPAVVKYDDDDRSRIYVIPKFNSSSEKRRRLQRVYVALAREDASELQGVSLQTDIAQRERDRSTAAAGQPTIKEQRLRRARLWKDEATRDTKVHVRRPKLNVAANARTMGYTAPISPSPVLDGPASVSKRDLFAADPYTSPARRDQMHPETSPVPDRHQSVQRIGPIDDGQGKSREILSGSVSDISNGRSPRNGLKVTRIKPL